MVFLLIIILVLPSEAFLPIAFYADLHQTIPDGYSELNKIYFLTFLRRQQSFVTRRLERQLIDNAQ